MSLLRMRDVRVHLQRGREVARAVERVDLDLAEGETLGLVGESGSGKTLLALSILGLLPGGARALLPGSSIQFRGEELVGMDVSRLRRLRGREIAMVFQEPMTSLNPVRSVGSQIREGVELHRGLRAGEARARTQELLGEVGIPDPLRVYGCYPHQLSGGMRQRALVAMALAGEPSVLLADEPTTALDVTLQLQILTLLRTVQERHGMAMLLISHDLDVVARVCDRVAVMYAGRLVEVGITREVLENPRHPYTRGLLGSRLSLRDRRRGVRPIPGEVPEATAWPEGCPFHPRCREALGRCRQELPPLSSLEDGGGAKAPTPERPHGHRVRCHLFSEKAGGSL